MTGVTVWKISDDRSMSEACNLCSSMEVTAEPKTSMSSNACVSLRMVHNVVHLLCVVMSPTCRCENARDSMIL